MNGKFKAFAKEVKKELFPNVKEQDWNVWDRYKGVRFGYKIDEWDLKEKEMKHDIIVDLTEVEHCVSVYMDTRGGQKHEDIKKLYSKIFSMLLSFLKENEYEGFVFFDRYNHDYSFVKTKDNKPQVPIGEKARCIQNLSFYMSRYFHYGYSNRYIGYSKRPNRKYYRIHPVLKKDMTGLQVDVKGKKKVFFTNEEEIKSFHTKMKKEKEKLDNWMIQLAKTLTSFDKNSYYDENRESIFLYGKMIPYFSQITFDFNYSVRAFYQTFEMQNFEELKEKIENHVLDYAKKNRVKSVLKGEIFDNNRKFYFKVFGRHSKTALKSIKKYIKTSLTDKEFFSLIDTEVNKEITPLSADMIEAFKKENNTRHKIVEGFQIGQLEIYKSSSIAFVKRSS